MWNVNVFKINSKLQGVDLNTQETLYRGLANILWNNYSVGTPHHSIEYQDWCLSSLFQTLKLLETKTDPHYKPQLQWFAQDQCAWKYRSNVLLLWLTTNHNHLCSVNKPSVIFCKGAKYICIHTPTTVHTGFCTRLSSWQNYSWKPNNFAPKRACLQMQLSSKH